VAWPLHRRDVIEGRASFSRDIRQGLGRGRQKAALQLKASQCRDTSRPASRMKNAPWHGSTPECPACRNRLAQNWAPPFSMNHRWGPAAPASSKTRVFRDTRRRREGEMSRWRQADEGSCIPAERAMKRLMNEGGGKRNGDALCRLTGPRIPIIMANAWGISRSRRKAHDSDRLSWRVMRQRLRLPFSSLERQLSTRAAVRGGSSFEWIARGSSNHIFALGRGRLRVRTDVATRRENVEGGCGHDGSVRVEE
jgi:hypothetical protein